MKLGDIKIEALKLMFVSYGEFLTTDSLPNYENDENYASYLVKMNGSINRCFADLERKRITPTRVKIFSAEDAKNRACNAEFDISALDMLELVRLDYENERGVRVSPFRVYEYIPEEKRLITRKISDGECYHLVYREKLKRLGYDEANELEIELPDTITSVIPFFIKGDLFREDEPNEAAEARNWYEQATEDIINSEQSGGEVVSVFSLSDV